MTQQHRFLTALKRLQDWHADSLKARDYNSPATNSSKPGAVILRVNRYPGTQAAFAQWRWARTDQDREFVIEQLENEYTRLSGPFGPRYVAYRDHWGKTRYRPVTP